MIEYSLTEIQQVALFFTTSTAAMLYHYADRWLSGHKRVLTSAKNIWTAGKINIQLVIGSTAWTTMYDVSSTDIAMAGLGIGYLAFSQGLTEFTDDR